MNRKTYRTSLIAEAFAGVGNSAISGASRTQLEGAGVCDAMPQQIDHDSSFGSKADAPRRSLREPIEDIRVAAQLMSDAVDAHLVGDSLRAEHLFANSNKHSVRAWTNSLWGKSSPYVKLRTVPGIAVSTPSVSRMPTTAQKRALHERDGFHCRYCGIPVVRKEVRQRAHELYPNAVTWSRRIIDQHAGFQAMWAQYDHVVPHSAGGTNGLENLVVTCAGCNFGKMSYRLEQLGLYDPRDHPPVRSSWDGLERLLNSKAPQCGGHGVPTLR